VRAAVSVVVAVIDSGWDRDRPDPRVLPGVALLAGERREDTHDRLGHGTACGAEVLRVAPGARIRPVRVFGETAATTPEALAAGIRWAAGSGAQVVCLSLGTPREEDRVVIESACEAAAPALLVAAGPNLGPPTYPAALPGVIGIWPGAGLAPGSLRARAGLDLEVGATGSGGTSLAAAAVAGHLAVLLAGGAPPDPALLLELLCGSRARIVTGE
jgi:subtilisin family serine protease